MTFKWRDVPIQQWTKEEVENRIITIDNKIKTTVAKRDEKGRPLITIHENDTDLTEIFQLADRRNELIGMEILTRGF